MPLTTLWTNGHISGVKCENISGVRCPPIDASYGNIHTHTHTHHLPKYEIAFLISYCEGRMGD